MSDEKGVTENSPSPLAEAIASTPEVVAEVEQKAVESQTPTAEEKGTPEPEEQQEEGRIPYSRFKETVDEKNWYKQQMEQMLQRQQTQQPIQQPTTNPYASMTPEEERFWRAVDERAGRIADEKLRQVTPIIEAGRMELAQSKVFQFRQAHPDIKPNSPEEMEIAQRISSGYLPDDAYWAVVGPRGTKVAEEKGKLIVKKQIEAKRIANVESTASVPKQAQPPQKKSFKEEFWENWKKAEEGKL